MRTTTAVCLALASCGTMDRDAPARTEDSAMTMTATPAPLALTVTAAAAGPGIAGRPIAVNVALTNRADAPVAVNRRLLLGHDLGDDVGDGELALVVTPDGAEPLVYQSLVTPAVLGDDDFTTLAPGTHLAVQIDLGRVYALRTAGRYAIVAHYRNADRRGWAGALASAPLEIVVEAGPPPIGHVTMLGDGTLHLELARPLHGSRIPPTAPEYAGILAHVGPMRPGDSRLVPPWPDAIDDAAVGKTVRDHVAAVRGWQVDEWTQTIMGTDKSGNVTVTVAYKGKRPPVGGKVFSLVVSADGTRVIDEIAVK